MIKDPNTKFTLWKLGAIPRFYSATFANYPIWSYRGWNFPTTLANKRVPIYEIKDFYLYHPDKGFIDKNQVNILLLHPYDVAMCNGNEFKMDNHNYEWMRKYTDIALHMGFKIFIDTSYDYKNSFNLDLNDAFFTKDKNYVLNNDIKYLTHLPPVNYYKLHNKYIEAEEEAKSQKYKEIEKHLIKFKTFKYQVRALYKNDLNTHPTNKHDKKYFFSLFFGEIAHPYYKILSFYQFNKRNLQKHSAWSTFLVSDPEIGYPNFHRNIENVNSSYLPLQELVINNKDKLKSFAKNKPHERYDIDKLYSNIDWTDKSINTKVLMQFDELKMPQCAFDSHLYVTYESFCEHLCWYTEKSWKPIAHGFPFIIHGCYLQNRYLKKLGYEIFEEIIDYSFEEMVIDPNNKDEWVYNYDIKFFDELERLVKEGPNLFYQPIIQEKIKHNRNLFFKETTTEKFLEDFERTFVHDTKN